MSNGVQVPEIIEVDVTTRGDLPGAADYARKKIGELGRLSHRPVLYARVRLTRHHDPAVESPVVAQANLDVNGRLVRAQVHAATAQEAIDLLEARLRRRLEHVAEHFDVRRRDRLEGGRSWRQEARPAQRLNHFQRATDRRVIRRKSFTMTPCTIDDAIAEMELLDYDFHLFTEKGSGTVGVLYRSEPTGYRLALVAPSVADELAPFSHAVTVSPHPPPCLREQDAPERLRLLGLPFLFFIDAAAGRAGVLYHRYDGHFGLITPAG
ncbi:integrase [Mycobacterium sp. Soil538]|nr:integrase [Mycobacterium sp. Soil538]